MTLPLSSYILVIVYTGGCLSLVNIKTFLKEEDFPADKAGELGTYLGINPGRISTLKSDNVGNADGMLSAILSEWLSNDGQSWEKLADVLRHLDHSLMADILREKANPLGGMHKTIMLIGGVHRTIMGYMHRTT